MYINASLLPCSNWYPSIAREDVWENNSNLRRPPQPCVCGHLPHLDVGHYSQSQNYQLHLSRWQQQLPFQWDFLQNKSDVSKI